MRMIADCLCEDKSAIDFVQLAPFKMARESGNVLPEHHVLKEAEYNSKAMSASTNGLVT